MRKFFTVATVLAVAVAFPAVAAAVTPGTYSTSSPGSFINYNNAPQGTHFANGSSVPTCTVDNSLNISCTGYTLQGVGHTNATLDLVANYTTTYTCTNHGKQLVEAQGQTVSGPGTPLTIRSEKNGNMTVPPESITAPHTVGQTGSGSPCPNRNWTWTVTGVTLNSFTYTLTFEHQSSPFIKITATDP